MSVDEGVSLGPAPGIRQVLVPVDGSAFARRAAGPAMALAAKLDATLTYVHVAGSPEEAGDDAAFRGIEGLSGASAEHRVLVGDDAGLAVGEYADEAGDAVVCMSSHGRGWPSSALVGSAAAVVLATTREPIVLVGPSCHEDWALGGRLAACVDGEPGGEAMLPVASAWSTALRLSLTVVTVAEPAPPPMRPGHSGRHHGPPGDPQQYIDRLTGEAGQGGGIAGQVTGDVRGQVIWDPVGVTDGLRLWFGDAPTGLLAISSHGRRPRLDTPLGNTALHIVHRSPVPVLVVPFVDDAERA